MNITQEDKGNLTKLLKVEIKPEDYKPAVDKQLKDYQKKAQEPGFRVGKVPFGIIDKKYGKAVRLDEVNKILSEKISDYIEENKLPILGQPLANEENMPKGDFAKDDTFEFFFDIGMAPELDFNLEDKTYDFYRIKVDDKQLDEYITNIVNQHGEQKSVDDEVKEKDVVKGTITELDENGEAKTDGILNENASLSMEYLQDEDVKNKFLGASKGDVINFDPAKAAGDNKSELASMLGVEQEDTEDISDNFSFEISDITRLHPAELNEELFKKVYPEDEITTEEAFRNKVKEDAEKAYERESERLLMAMASDDLVENTELELPHEFLKRWLVQNDENLTPEKLEADYDKYAKTMKWQLIENKIIKENDIEVKDEEVKDQIRKYFMQQMGGGEISEEMQKQLEPIVDSMMQNKEQTKQIYDQLFDEKLAKTIKEKVNLNEKEVSYDEFIKIAQSQQSDDDNHNHDHEEEPDNSKTE